MTEFACEEPLTDLDANSPYAAWLRVMAWLYDPFVWLGEIAGMRRRRGVLLAEAHGRVVEIGAGTGLNIAHYPDAVCELILTEPEPSMRRKLARRLERHGRAARILDVPAERFPFADGSVDTVVSTLVLATACGTDTGRDPVTRAVPEKQPQLAAGAVHDGWAVRLRRDSAPIPCHFTPDQVQRMMESGAPLPGCVRRNTRWFHREFEPLAGDLTRQADR